MRYAELEAHHDLGLGAEEFGIRRFTRICEHASAEASSGDAARELDQLETRIVGLWKVWETLAEGRSRSRLAHTIHRLEDRADALCEELRAIESGQENGPRPVGAGSEAGDSQSAATENKEPI